MLRITVPQPVSDARRSVLGLPLERLVTLPERMIRLTFDDLAELLDFSLAADNRRDDLVLDVDILWDLNSRRRIPLGLEPRKRTEFLSTGCSGQDEYKPPYGKHKLVAGRQRGSPAHAHAHAPAHKVRCYQPSVKANIPSTKDLTPGRAPRFFACVTAGCFQIGRVSRTAFAFGIEREIAEEIDLWLAEEPGWVEEMVRVLAKSGS